VVRSSAASDVYKRQELLHIDNFYINDIVDINTFKTLPNERVKIVLPSIKKVDKIKNIEKSPINIGDRLLQEIIPNNNTFLRAFITCHYWNSNILYDHTIRNLGYFSELQTKLINILKSKIIDYLIETNTDKDTIIEYNKNIYNTDMIFEITTLSILFPKLHIVIYNEVNHVMYSYLNGIRSKYKDRTNDDILIQCFFNKNTNVPYRITSILFV
jgi:hypothetical protein